MNNKRTNKTPKQQRKERTEKKHFVFCFTFTIEFHLVAYLHAVADLPSRKAEPTERNRPSPGSVTVLQHQWRNRSVSHLVHKLMKNRLLVTQPLFYPSASRSTSQPRNMMILSAENSELSKLFCFNGFSLDDGLALTVSAWMTA